MSLVTFAVTWAAALYCIDAAYFHGIHYNAFHTVISQMTVYY